MTTAPKNLIPNASFEEVTKGLPGGWRRGAPRPELAPTVSLDTVVARSGKRSLCFSGAGIAGVTGWINATCEGIQGGDTYELKAYFRVEDIVDLHESVWVKLAWRSGKKNLNEPWVVYLTAEPVVIEGWWCVSGTFRAPEQAVSAEVSLSLRGAPYGRLWWDDISLCRVAATPPRRLRIATAYLPQDQRNPEGWTQAIRQAGEGKADIVCLGEMVEIIPKDPQVRPTIPGAATEALGAFAREYGMYIIASIPEWEGALRYNTAVLINREGQVLGRYHKTHLPQSEVEFGTTAGSAYPVFETDFGRIGMQICYDHFFPEVTRALALNGAEIVFTSIMGDVRTEGRAYDAVARARALDNTVYYVTSIRDTGRSLIIDPAGTILADSDSTPGVVFADIDLDAPFYEPWLSVEGSAPFRHLWRKERRPNNYQLLTRGDE